MVVSNTIFSNLFGGQNTFNIDPDKIVDVKFTVLDEEKPFIYTQNNLGNRNPEGFFTQAGNGDSSKLAHSSHTVAQFYAASYRSLGNGSTKYGSSGSSSFISSNREKAQVGRQLAFSA
ncbi:MAG: hypothetical protein ACKO3R_03185 [bacterium]